MYPSDMIDEQWSAKALSGRQACRQTPDAQPRDMLNAIFYAQATGYQWRALPKDFPPWKQICSNAFARCHQRGVWDTLLAPAGARQGRRVGP